MVLGLNTLKRVLCSFLLRGSLCKVQGDIILLPLIGEGRDGEFPVRNRQCVTPAFEPESPTSLEGFKIYSVHYKVFNYATLNQLCIQAHTSSLRCGGSLCKVQDDKTLTPHSNSLPIGRENKMPFTIR